MPRAKKPKADASVAIAETAETLSPAPASELPAQLPPPEPVLERLPRAEQEPQGKPELGSHTAAVLANRRPNFAPVPDGFKNVLHEESAGIRANRGVERSNLGTAAIQFAEDRPLSRATEYDLMEQVQKAGFQYKAANRQWERPLQPGMELGDNVIEAARIAKEIAEARGIERGR